MKQQRLIRSTNLLAKPIRLTPAFSDPDAIMALVRAGAPYKTLAAVHKNTGDKTGGWFRNFWALGGKVVLPGAEPHFHNENFILAAKESFQAEIIRPLAMMTNFNLPAPGAPHHLDLPFFRGAQNREVPSWMLAPMGYSGLFHDWAIPVASAITWFYDGVGGEFEYWPEGLDKPSETVAPPYSNSCVLADNEYMFHRVGAIGSEAEQHDHADISHDAKLALEDDRWQLEDPAHPKQNLSYDFGQVRLSILWKAYCFKDGAEADAFDDKQHDLTPALIAEILQADLKQKGVRLLSVFNDTSLLFSDPAWKQALIDTYTPKGAASY